MRFERLFQWGEMLYKTKLDAPDIREIRISPRSFRAGEHCGFVCGLGAGFVFGVMFLAAAFGMFG